VARKSPSSSFIGASTSKSVPALRSAATVLNPLGSPIARLLGFTLHAKCNAVRPFGSAACARSGAAASSRFDGCGVPSFGGLEKRGFRGLSHSYALRGTAIMPTTPLCWFSSPRPSLRSKAFLLRKRRRRYRSGNGAALIEIALADGKGQSALP
jgi:hypothetical protein